MFDSVNWACMCGVLFDFMCLHKQCVVWLISEECCTVVSCVYFGALLLIHSIYTFFESSHEQASNDWMIHEQINWNYMNIKYGFCWLWNENPSSLCVFARSSRHNSRQNQKYKMISQQYLAHWLMVLNCNRRHHRRKKKNQTY